MLVQPSEVTPLLGLDREMTPGEQAAIASLLSDIEVEVVALIGALEVASHTETIVARDPYPQCAALVFYTTATPVQSITSVTINSTALTTANYSFDSYGVKVYNGFTRSVLVPNYTVSATVVYTAGHPESVLAEIRPVVKRRAVRLLNKVGDQAIGTDRVSLEGYTSAWMSENFTQTEEGLIRRAAGTHWTVSSPDTTEVVPWFSTGSGSVDWAG